MDSKLIIETILKKYNFRNFPENYKDSIVLVLETAKKELKENLVSITLGGSGGKNNIIEGWSDLDIYIVLKEYDINQIKNLQRILSKNNIHIGLTIYNLYELENDLIDFKTKIMLYEKNNYHVNPTLYGYDYFRNVSYQEVYQNDMLNYPVVLQAFKRMYIEVLNNERKIDKTYIKKMLVLLKCILSNYKIFAYGYNEVLQEFIKILYNEPHQIYFEDIIKDLENNQNYLINISREIIEYTEKEELFKKSENKFKSRKLQVI